MLKDLIGRPHPVEAGEWSYPSTHVAMVTVGAIIAAMIAARLLPRWRHVAATLAAAAVVSTAATRIVLGEHHITDVTATAVAYAAVSIAVTLLSTPALVSAAPVRAESARLLSAGRSTPSRRRWRR